MDFYVILTLFSVIFTSFCGVIIFRKYKNPSGFFFLFLTFCISLWLSSYFLFFSWIDEANLLLFLSRFCFSLSILGVYSFLFFVVFFDTEPATIFNKKTLLVLLGFCGVVVTCLFWDVVSGLEYSSEKMIYREIYGKLFPIYTVVCVSFAPLFMYFSYKQLKTQTLLNKIRLRNIVIVAFLTLFSLMTLQLILPAMGIWLFEKELVLLPAFFVIYIFYTLRRYYFEAGYGIGRWVLIVLSLIIAVAVLNLIRLISIEIGSIGRAASYWWVKDSYFVMSTIVGVGVFLLAFRILRSIFPGWTFKIELERRVRWLERELATTTHLPTFEKKLEKGIRSIFQATSAWITLFQPEQESHVRKYFRNPASGQVFMNDWVFIEERQRILDPKKFLSELPDGTFLALPLSLGKNEWVIGAFSLGNKVLWDFYTIDEIEVLRGFTYFIERQLQYIRIYSELEILSASLDLRVDEKTMEFNNLINRQKEFISMISHEVRAPIANAIILADSMLDDAESEELTPEEFRRDLWLLDSQLARAGELVTKLFTMQYFETREVALFKEKILIADFLEEECRAYEHAHPEIRCINLIDRSIGFVKIDRVQFGQVISNLLQNSIKHLQNTIEPKIAVEAFLEENNLVVIVEDNGPGFSGIDENEIFDRYTTTGKGDFASLGMWLYLCKKIVEMHHGTIQANKSEKLSWAKFTITLPLS